MRNSNNKGFTLTEVAIVIGVMGFIFAGIWTGASAMYENWKVSYLLENIVTFQAQSAATLSTYAISPTNYENNTMDDTCGEAIPCGTRMFQAIGALQPGFVGKLTSGANYGLSTMFTDKYGDPIWTGLENGDIYINQDGECGTGNTPSCTSNVTVAELDLMNLTPSVCVKLIMQIVNLHSGNLVDIAGPNEGWGPIEGGAYYGNPTLPENLTSIQAEAACSTGNDPYGYVNTNKSYIWMWFKTSGN